MKREKLRLSDSRSMIMDTLVREGRFHSANFIQNEVRASALVLFKATAKVFKIPFEESNKISTDATYAEKLKEPEYTGWLRSAVQEYGFAWEDHWDLVENKMDIIYSLKSIPYNSSSAASGVIMTNEPANLPVRDQVIGYNGEDLEKNGYIKYDLLSVDTLNMIGYFKGIDIDWNERIDVIETPIGDIGMDQTVETEDGYTMTGVELWDAIRSGKTVDVKLP